MGPTQLAGSFFRTGGSYFSLLFEFCTLQASRHCRCERNPGGEVRVRGHGPYVQTAGRPGARQSSKWLQYFSPDESVFISCKKYCCLLGILPFVIILCLVTFTLV